MIKRVRVKVVNKSKNTDPTYSVNLPNHGCKISVIYGPNDIAGTLLLGDEVVPVYLGNLKAEQIGAERLYGPVRSPSNIKRIFTFIEV